MREQGHYSKIKSRKYVCTERGDLNKFMLGLEACDVTSVLHRAVAKQAELASLLFTCFGQQTMQKPSLPFRLSVRCPKSSDVGSHTTEG